MFRSIHSLVVVLLLICGIVAIEAGIGSIVADEIDVVGGGSIDTPEEGVESRTIRDDVLRGAEDDSASLTIIDVIEGRDSEHDLASATIIEDIIIGRDTEPDDVAGITIKDDIMFRREDDDGVTISLKSMILASRKNRHVQLLAGG